MLKQVFLNVSPLLAFVIFFSCSGDDSPTYLSESEKKLVGGWVLEKAVYQEPGQPESVYYPTDGAFCFMNFKEDNSPLLDQSSQIYSNTKLVDDHKDCSWLWNAWKIEKNGKLLLVSLDTVYADIQNITNTSLVLKMTFDNYYGSENSHYVSTNTYFLVRK